MPKFILTAPSNRSGNASFLQDHRAACATGRRLYFLNRSLAASIIKAWTVVSQSRASGRGCSEWKLIELASLERAEIGPVLPDVITKEIARKGACEFRDEVFHRPDRCPAGAKAERRCKVEAMDVRQLRGRARFAFAIAEGRRQIRKMAKAWVLLPRRRLELVAPCGDVMGEPAELGSQPVIHRHARAAHDEVGMDHPFGRADQK